MEGFVLFFVNSSLTKSIKCLLLNLYEMNIRSKMRQISRIKGISRLVEIDKDWRKKRRGIETIYQRLQRRH